MRIGVTLKYYLRDLLSKPMLIMIAAFVGIAVFLPLTMAVMDQSGEIVLGTVDIFTQMVVYVCIFSGIYTKQYTNMHIALGTTRKTIWFAQTLLGTVILPVVTVAIAAITQLFTTRLIILSSNIMGLNVGLRSMSLMGDFLKGFSWPARIAFLFAVPFTSMALVQCLCYFWFRWKKGMMLFSAVIGALLIWITVTNPYALLKVLEIVGMIYSGTFLVISLKIILTGFVLLVLSYIPLRRMPIKK